MKAGDVYTHCFNGSNVSIALLDRSLDPAALAARARGVKFCVGHGQGAFNWPVAEAAASATPEHGGPFWPDAISTDLHAGSLNGPAYDMPTVMPKFLMLGLPLAEVIRRSTCGAAASMGLPPDDIGTLTVGSEADVTVLAIESCDVQLEDVAGNVRHCRERLVCRCVWRKGERHMVTEEPVWPNPESQAWARLTFDRWYIQDATPPPDLYPELASAMAEKQRHYAFLAVMSSLSPQTLLRCAFCLSVHRAC
eukprot:SAG31_NODE_1353_length_8663_cov_6.353690_4_plen_251_part_00